MKIKTQPENILEWIALKMNLAPLPLVDTQVAFNAARAIMAAAELDMYEVIGKGSKSANEVSSICKTHPAATKQLLDCLVGIGYLNWCEEKYSIKKKYQKWLLKEFDSNLIGKLRFQIYEWNWMARLEDYVKTGQPQDIHTTSSPEIWESYQQGMRDLSVNAAKELAGKIPVPKNATQMLDIGGSHGLYSIELCKKYSRLNSTILELPDAISAASAIGKKYDPTGRINYKAGNALNDDTGIELYDIVMINNVVHHFPEDQNKMLAKKIAKALKPDGLFLIGEFTRNEKPGEGGVVGATSGLYFSLTSSSGTWSVKEIESWISGAGLKIEKPVSPMTIPGWKMLIGKKK
jgi:2-polyprenyl-3-methyl-5-hydroxy-6-metoxy-1,4-benzoquinol methylase